MGDAIGTALFVGGPKDGEWLPIQDDSPPLFRVPVLPDRGPGPCSPPPGAYTAEHYHVVEYRLETFHTPDKDFYFWLAPDLSPEDLMVRLVLTYHQALLRTPHATLRTQAAALLPPTGDR